MKADDYFWQTALDTRVRAGHFELEVIRRDCTLLLDSILSETETLPEAPPAEAPTKEEKPEEKKSALDEAREDAEPKDAHGGSKSPEDGLCRECRQRRKLNRLKLCYACFAILILMEECKKRGFEWKPGDKHPDWCSCEGLGEHSNRDHGSWRGN